MAGASKVTNHNVSPVAISSARKAPSMVASMKTKPPPVTMGPPEIGPPQALGEFNIPNGPKGTRPKGRRQRYAPVLSSMAESSPHGGGLHGMPKGDYQRPPSIR